MLNEIFITDDPFDLDKWSHHTFEGDVRDFIMEYFSEWPETAHLYYKEVCEQNDVTPKSPEDVERLGKLEGRFFLVIYPAGPVFVAVAVAIIAVVAIAFLLQPSIPTPSIRIPNQSANRQDSSPNNDLSERVNRPRVNGRIPDIFGQVRSTPDLIAVPYRVYENHQEIEIGYLCVGRGEYDISEVKDGETLVSEIAGTTVEIFAPSTSPNSGDAPQLRIGTAISEDVVKAVEISGVNGQTLRAPNADSVVGNSDIKFVYPDTIQINSASDIDFTDYFGASDSLTISGTSYSGDVDPFTQTGVSVKFTYAGEIVFQTGDPTQDFEAGDTLTIADASRTDGSNPVDLAGSYTISSVNSTTITLDNPSSVNSDWNTLDLWSGDETGFDDSDIGVSEGTRSGDLNGTYTILSVGSTTIALSNPAAVNSDWYKLNELTDDETPYGSPTLSTSGNKWVGPFFIDVTDLEEVYSNFIALNGLYKDNGTQQVRFDVVVELEVTPVDANGDATGSAETFQGTIQGSATLRDARAITIKANPTFTGRCKVRARRVTNADLEYNGTVIDTIKWQKVYGISPITETHFGNVTTAFTKTYATTGATSVKERKLNMLATRKLPTRISGSTFTSSLTATKSVDEILSFICLDQYIGNRIASEIDFDSIYDTVDTIEAYFGSSDAVEFSYTFDNDNISFEETVAAVAEAVFCQAYRQGNQIKLKFEQATEDSTLIFNHRNKSPGSEKRSIRFGNQDNHDGVELEYVSPDDDILITYYIPTDRSAVNPRQVETLGIRTDSQAFWHAWRVWNKIQYQNTITEFEALQEAATSIIRDRILVADNTRPETQDGDVQAQSGLTLTLSQDITFEAGKSYVIFLQHYDGTVESINITAGNKANQVILANAPKLALSVDESLYARATYVIVPDDDPRTQAFLLAEKDPQDTFSYTLTAVNYSPLYYQQDELQLWFPFFDQTYTDLSPFGRDGTAQGSSAIVVDGTRGNVHQGGAAADYCDIGTFTPPTSYTKMCWINKDDLTSLGHLLSSDATTHESFSISAAGKLQAGHSNVLNSVEYDWPAAAAWHHAAVSYDATSTTLTLYIDGVQVHQNTSVAQRTLADVQFCGYNSDDAILGFVDDMRLYKRALTATEIKEIYKKSTL